MHVAKTKEKNIYRDVITGTFYWREYIEGKSHCKSTKVVTLGAAKTKVKKFRAELALGNLSERGKISFDLVFDHLLDLQKTKAHKTFLMAKNHINNHLRPWLLKHSPFIIHFDAGNMETFLARLLFDHDIYPNGESVLSSTCRTMGAKSRMANGFMR